MAGIVAALEAHDDVGLFRQPVDDLALPFVAPLGADDDNIGHLKRVPYNSRASIMNAPERVCSFRIILFIEHDLSENRYPRCANAALRVRIVLSPAGIAARAARMRGSQSDKGSG